MLVLARKKGQEIWIDEKIRIIIKSVGSRPVLMIDAPKEVRVRRGEIERKPWQE